jgi:hypothetical protein
LITDKFLESIHGMLQGAEGFLSRAGFEQVILRPPELLGQASRKLDCGHGLTADYIAHIFLRTIKNRQKAVGLIGGHLPP